MRKITTAIVTAVLLAAASQGVAQSIVLKDGSKLGPDQFKIEEGKVMKIVKVGSNVATSVLQMSGVLKLEWPTPVELTEGTALLASGKTEEGLAMLKKGRDLFEPFKEVPGNHFADLSFAYVEALGQAGKFEDTIKAMPALRLLKLTDAQKTKLKIIQLNIERQTSSDYASIIAQAQNILSETDDSAVGASLWMIQGDVYYKQKQWEKALLAYLRVPVFYGSQVQRVPEAEMAAAGALAKMRRFEDAAGFYKRIIESYPGSGMAEKAKTEEAAIRGLKNESDAPAKSDAPAADAKAADAAPAK
jgi:tetratricopeptide (TPR) repeat protein